MAPAKTLCPPHPPPTYLRYCPLTPNWMQKLDLNTSDYNGELFVD